MSRSQNLRHNVINQVIDDMARGHIPSPLPSQSALAEMYNISRTTVRHILSHLRECGVLTQVGNDYVIARTPEPNGPGSSEMKAKCTSGTQGTYSGVPEYQLNLEVSLQLKDELEQRGYQVVMTRTDNETAISNMERAQYAAAQGAEIYVRIHANGDDSHTASGALTMSPSQNNPYIPQLFEQSDRLSRCIIDSYCAATGFQNLGTQYTDTMTGINWSTVPVTILEMGFMTSQNDDLKMNDAEFQKTMVQGIANGIDSYFAS